MIGPVNSASGGYSSYHIFDEHKKTSGISKSVTEEQNTPFGVKEEEQEDKAISFGPKSVTGKELTKDEQEEIEALKKRDAEVKQHEQAHVSAAGVYARGGANYEYDTGPDGQKYAKAGHVNIDISKEDDPNATIAKAQVVRRAALAPVDPSGQDQKIAAKASQMEMEARQELAKEEQSKREEESGNSPLNPLVGEKTTAADFTKRKNEDIQAVSPFAHQNRIAAYNNQIAPTAEELQNKIEDISVAGGPSTETFSS